MSKLAWHLVWLSVVLTLVGWHWLSLAVAAGLFVWFAGWHGCEGAHSLQSSKTWRSRRLGTGRWHQTRWRCVRCGERFEAA